MKTQWNRDTDKEYNNYQCKVMASYVKHGHSEIEFVEKVAVKYEIKHNLNYKKAA